MYHFSCPFLHTEDGRTGNIDAQTNSTQQQQQQQQQRRRRRSCCRVISLYSIPQKSIVPTRRRLPLEDRAGCGHEACRSPHRSIMLLVRSSSLGARPIIIAPDSSNHHHCTLPPGRHTSHTVPCLHARNTVIIIVCLPGSCDIFCSRGVLMHAGERGWIRSTDFSVAHACRPLPHPAHPPPLAHPLYPYTFRSRFPCAVLLSFHSCFLIFLFLAEQFLVS